MQAGGCPDIHAYAIELGITSALIARRGLVVCEEACELERVALAPDGREHFLIPAAAQAWRLLHAAAQADGIDLFIVSAFRSVERQAEIVRRKLASGQSLETILAVSAPPGFSE
ncbi:MAG: D-alanyl-D-alanine carboxypeptidase family protein, partial [Rhodoferax sp.]|nr:D-alanyl-D-alanine carboxypeptidase family protein [Rhodoferax sp.]